jgi:hypothetical protein
MCRHNTTFQDVFIGDDGVKVEFGYTRSTGNRWHVVAQVAVGYGFVEIYTAQDEKPESLEVMFTTHRAAVAQLLANMAKLVAVKGLLQ